MPSVTVRDKFSPSKKGPGHLTAKTALEDINNANQGWNVILDWKAEVTTYTSNIANRNALLTAVQGKFNQDHYLVA